MQEPRRRRAGSADATPRAHAQVVEKIVEVPVERVVLKEVPVYVDRCVRGVPQQRGVLWCQGTGLVPC